MHRLVPQVYQKILPKATSPLRSYFRQTSHRHFFTANLPLDIGRFFDKDAPGTSKKAIRSSAVCLYGLTRTVGVAGENLLGSIRRFVDIATSGEIDKVTR